MMKFISRPVTFRDALIGFASFELLKLALPMIVVASVVVAIVWAVSHYDLLSTRG